MKLLRTKDAERIAKKWEDHGILNAKWLGVTAYKNPADAWLYQEIIYKVKPNFILETGSCEGGGALFLASMLDLCKIKDGVVYSIELEEYKKPFHPRIKWIKGNSIDPDIVTMIVTASKGKRGLVILDSDHDSRLVLTEMRCYWQIVNKNSYLIVEDTWYGTGKGGPHDAVKEFLKENKHFEIDKSMHRFLITNNPEGFLKRNS